MEKLQSEAKIPVTLLTGFLGAGKTTLLNRILTENHGKKIAVIENEFGEVGIDHALVMNSEEEIFEMNNGCICCTVRGDLIRILGKLAQKKNKFDYVIIETTGMADPSPVAQTFYLDSEVQEHYRLDGVITLVDSKHVHLHIDESEECREQIGFADVILLNKTDLVDSEAVAHVEGRIHQMNPFAKIHRTEKATLPFTEILDQSSFDLKRALEIDPKFLEPEYPFEWLGIYELAAGTWKLEVSDTKLSSLKTSILPVPGPTLDDFTKIQKSALLAFSAKPRELQRDGIIPVDGTLCELSVRGEPAAFKFKVETAGHFVLMFDHCTSEFKMRVSSEQSPGVATSNVFHKHFHGQHTHQSDVGSVGIDVVGNLHPQRFQKWISELLQTRGQDIYRSKGVLSLEGNPRRYIFQGVHMLMNGEEEREWGTEARRNLIVFIGKNLNREELTAGFMSCMMKV